MKQIFLFAQVFISVLSLRAKERPNIIWLMAEDMSLDLECYFKKMKIYSERQTGNVVGCASGLPGILPSGSSCDANIKRGRETKRRTKNLLPGNKTQGRVVRFGERSSGIKQPG